LCGANDSAHLPMERAPRSAPLARLAVVVDDFDVVAVGVEHIGGVVAGVIARALTGLAVAAISGRGRGGVESAYVVVCARERGVLDSAPRPLSVAVDGLEAVAGGVFEKCGVVVVGENPTRAGGSVIREARVDAGLPEAIDMTWARRDERDVDAPCDRMILVS